MKKVFLLLGLFLLMLPMVMANSATINTANNTEFNTLTPDISITCVSDATMAVNVTAYFTSNDSVYAQVIDYQDITNNTATTFTTDAFEVRDAYHLEAVCINKSDNSTLATSANKTILINGQPVISSLTLTSGYVRRGSPVTFTVDWADANTTGTGNDTVSLFVCDSNGFSGGACTGTQLCTEASQTDGESSCSYTLPYSLPGGHHTVYAFLEDDNSYDSSGTSGIYGSVGYVEDEGTQGTQTITPQGSGSNTLNQGINIGTILWIIVLIVLIIIGYNFFKK